MMWAGSRWCLLAAATLSVPGFESALPAAWTQTCSACWLAVSGMNHVLAKAASFLDHRSFCLAVFCGPIVRFSIKIIWLLHFSYCFNAPTLLHTPHTHTPDTNVVSAAWKQLMCSHHGRYWCVALLSRSNGWC